jgi:hypothetical protein
MMFFFAKCLLVELERLMRCKWNETELMSAEVEDLLPLIKCQRDYG